MSTEVTGGPSARERLGLGPDATDAEVRETYRELERFLAPSNVPRRLQAWASMERSVAGRALSAEKAPPPTARPAKPRPRPSDLPDFFDEDLRDDTPAPRRASDARRYSAPPRAVAPQARRRRKGTPVWRSAVLVLALVLVAAGIVYWSLPGGGLPASIFGSGAATTSAGQTDTATPLNQARVAELTRQVQANPNDTTALFELGEMHFQAQKWQESIDWFTKLLAIDPTDTHARTDVGTSNYNLGRYDEAKAAWEEVVRRDPNDAQAHYNLAFYYLNGPAPDMEKALVEWQKVVDIAPDSQLGKTAKTHIDALKPTSSGQVPAPAAAP